MAPLRIGFIGLSASGGWASNAHLPYLRTTDKYRIVALCNSSEEAARAAIDKHGLPAETRAYGSPAALAADADVDLVVCGVRVDRHAATLRPALEAGKAVYVEWPLGASLGEAEELAGLARRGGARTMVGLQARRSPVVNAVRRLVRDGRVGRVLSCSVVSSVGNFGPTESPRTKYFTDRGVGGNMVTIHFAHAVDYVLYVLGELEEFTSLLAIQRPQVDIVDADGKVVDSVTKTTHDQIMLQGTLKSGAVLSIHQRGGSPFKGTPGLTWRIYGESGEIMVTADGSFLQIGYPNMEIKVHDFGGGKDTVETVDWTKEIGNEVSLDLPAPALNVGRLYEAFADGRRDEYVDMEEAVVRHRLLDQLYKSSESSSRQQVSYI